MRAMPAGFGRVFDKSNAEAAEEKLRELAAQYSQQLKDRAAAELPLLPFAS